MPRRRTSRAQRQPTLPGILIPDKLYFRIKEVSELTETKAYVLRYWETEFPLLKPERKSGQRLYRRQDVEMVFRIKQLLYAERFTIDGARKQLDAEAGGAAARPLRVTPEGPSGPDGLARLELKAIRRELESILTMLSRRC
ncbi:MAG TPA: MerR family transcriptional regulator [Terriglobia bacterium]|nr:MerR family transcriptional regulator [Terriglobia bacterium]